jgi:hypothetical protein
VSIADIDITEPVGIRGYFPGGRGGYGYSSTPVHRLVKRTSRDDVAACGTRFTNQSIVVTNGVPTARQAAKHGLCPKCWAK